MNRLNFLVSGERIVTGCTVDGFSDGFPALLVLFSLFCQIVGCFTPGILPERCFYRMSTFFLCYS